MIILYPDEVVIFASLGDHIGAGLIDPLVCLPQTLVVPHILRKIMEKRPDSSIAESEIKIINVRFCQKDRKAVFRLQFSLDFPFLISNFFPIQYRAILSRGWVEICKKLPRR